MKVEEKSGKISSVLILAGLWIINIVIVIFSFPFLVYKKLHDFCTGNSQKFQTATKGEKNSGATYLPNRFNSKLHR